jgi:hypothetical protein
MARSRTKRSRRAVAKDDSRFRQRQEKDTAGGKGKKNNNNNNKSTPANSNSSEFSRLKERVVPQNVLQSRGLTPLLQSPTFA